MECTNKLKQMALAVHNFYDSKGYLPSANFPVKEKGIFYYGGWGTTSDRSSTGGVYWRQYMGYAYPLLPHLEQQATYEMIAKHLENNTAGPTDGSMANGQLSAFWCPSDPDANVSSWCATSYRACRGDTYISGSYTSRTPRGFFDAGVYSTSSTPSSEGGLGFIPNLRDLNSITDGTSNTIAFSEGKVWRGPSAAKKAYPVAGGFVIQTTLSTPAACMALAGAGESAGWLPESMVGRNYMMPGVNYLLGAGISAVCTVCPPNQPYCCTSETYSAGDGGTELATPSSYHSGGVNCAFGDGTVRFISETIDCGTTTQSVQSGTGASIGESRWGVWGALGSCIGGETKTL